MSLAISTRGLILGSSGSGSGAAGPPWEVLPSIFSNGTLPANLLYDAGTDTYSTDYNASTYRVASATYYVRTTGDDTTGDGLSAGTAWRTITKALTTAATGSKIDVGPGRFAAFSAPTAKSFWIKCATGPLYTDKTFIGTFLTNADVSSWGTFASGRQSITLSASAVSGFVDLLATGTNGAPYNTSRSVTNGTTAIAAVQALGAGGIFRSTPSALGATGAGRDLTNTFDTDVIAWSAAQTTPAITMAGTAQVMLEDAILVGGGSCNTAAVTSTFLILHNTSQLGAIAEGNNFGARNITYGGYFRNCAPLLADILDYSGVSSRFVEINVNAWDGAYGGADNASTAHSGCVGFRIGGSYGGCGRPIHDVGDTMTATVACTVGGGVFGTTTQMIAAGNDGGVHPTYSDSSGVFIAQITFTGTAPSDAYARSYAANICQSRVFVYDDSLDGLTTVGPIVDRSGARPTAAKTFFTANAYDLTKLFQDQAGTIPVVADGDPVGRVVINSDGDYLLGTNIVYKTLAGLSWFETIDTSHFEMRTQTAFETNMCMIMTADANDASVIAYAQATTDFIDARNAGGVIGRSARTANNYSVRVNKVAVTTASFATGAGLWRTAAFSGGAKVSTLKNIELDWPGYMIGTLGAAWLGASNGIAGKIYDMRWIRYTDDAGMATAETASALLGGLSI